ncbi:MAG: SpoIIE family protein phosphatase [Bacteroidales bacterium]|nr:SpoIIE family protein phosphatase [Bacteroidales bacterium]
MWFSKSFSTRLSLNVLLIVTIFFIVVLGIVAVSSHLLISEEATRSASNILKTNILDIEKTLQTVESTVKDASWLAKENKDSEKYLYHITQKVVAENTNIIGSAIAFDSCYFRGRHFFSPYSYEDPETGELKSKELGSDENDYFTQEWYTVPKETGQPHWSEPYFDAGGGEQMMTTYSYPINDSAGTIYAIITADISLDWLSKKIDQIHPYEHSFTTLLSANGRYLSAGWQANLASETAFTYAEKLDDPRVLEISKNMVAGDSGTMRFWVGSKLSFAVYGPLSNGWSMAINCEYGDVLERSSQMHMMLIIVGLLGLLIMFIMCYFKIRQLTQPLKDFSASALNIAKGDFNAKLPEVKSKDEILQLHDSLAYMQQSIVTYLEQIETATSAKKRMETQLYIGQKIQEGMLPKNFPNDSRCSLNAKVIPAKEVGGDLYDFTINDNRLYFSVGDVSGKGVPAAFVMAITRVMCHLFADLGLSVQEIATRINNSVAKNNDANMFVTLFVGCINLETKQLEYCNAGHNPIIVIPPDENPYYLKAIPNMAVGVWSGFEYKSENLDLRPGTKLLLYTDGVNEAEKVDKEQFGEERLLQLVSKPEFKNLNSEEMVSEVLDAVKDFAGDNEQNDDITIFAITI